MRYGPFAAGVAAFNVLMWALLASVRQDVFPLWLSVPLHLVYAVFIGAIIWTNRGRTA